MKARERCRGFGRALLAALAMGGSMIHASSASAASPAAPVASGTTASVRYLVGDVGRAVAFYTGRLGFRLDQQAGGAFAAVSRGGLQLVLSGPGSPGARPLPDGRRQDAGGSNRIILYVSDLDAVIRDLQASGTRFRNGVEAGPGGKQVQVEDPDGNPVELHELPGAR